MAGGAGDDGNAATDEHRVAGHGPGVRLLVLASSCAAVAVLATALFFLLHHLGNQLPYDLAAQRLKADFESDRPDPGHANGYKATLEHCMMSSAALAGARRASGARKNPSQEEPSAGEREGEPLARKEPSAGRSQASSTPRMKSLQPGSARGHPSLEKDALRNAVLLRTLHRETGTTCSQLEAAANGAEIPKRILLTRYWWGGKALYAIALRYGSVHEIRNLIWIGTYVAYGLLAISLLLLSPKMLLLGAPLLAFGAFFSGIEYWAGIANGLPYLWTVLFAAGLALLVRLERLTRLGVGSAEGEYKRRYAWAGIVPVYCFAAGTVSSYLWLGDGHTFLAVTWIGMVVWFGCDALNVAERTRRAVLCVVLYGAGIVLCYALGQMVKAMFFKGVWRVFLYGLVNNVEASAKGAIASAGYLDSFYAAYWPSSWPSGVVPTFVAASALAVSLGLAVFEARRKRAGLLWGVLWIVGLLSSCSLTFLVMDDIHYRTARYVFAPLALCLSCLLLSLRTTHWRMSLATARKLSALMFGLFVVAGAISWYLTTFNSRAVDEVIASVDNMRPIASAAFDVYLDEDRLVYVKEECDAEDVDALFFLHLYPADVGDLHSRRRLHGYDNLEFAFETFGLRGGGRCAAVRILPICIQPPCAVSQRPPLYELVAIHTGQYVPGEDRKWSERVVLPGAVDKIIRSVEDMRPAASSAFDLYFDEARLSKRVRRHLHGAGRLVYVKEDCSDEDVDAPFFLHLYPADVADLPLDRQPHGFDNLDFSFERFGFRNDGRCAAVRILPDYEVVAIQTGQYVPGEDREWSERIDLNSLE